MSDIDPHTVTLFVPFLGKSMNWHRGANPYAYKKLKDQCATAVLAAGVLDVVPFTRPVDLDFTPMLGPGRRSWDTSNYACTYKQIEDCIVQAGALRDDSNAYVYDVHHRRPIRAKTLADECIIVQITARDDAPAFGEQKEIGL